MPHAFADAIRRALTTDHAALALTSGSASKYPAAVAPFAAADTEDPAALAALHSMLLPGEAVWLYAYSPARHPGLHTEASLNCVQMPFPTKATLPERTATPSPLTCADAPAMLALTDLAFPGFYRPRTCEMGRYFGFWEGDTLVAMGGERLSFTADGVSYREISGLCTHPAHRGRGYAIALLAYLLHLHRVTEVTSWLHVATTNPAQNLYKNTGFVVAGEVTLEMIRRT